MVTMEFFNSLRVLLKDMCEFLENEVLNSVKTDNAVLSKARVLLTTVRTMDTNVQQKIAADTGGYLEMNLHQPDSYVEADLKPTDDDECYSTADDISSETKTDTVIACPYQDNLISELQSIVREGTLHRKACFIFAFIPAKRPFHVVLIDEWILFYNNDKKGKTLESYNANNIVVKSTDDDTGFTMKVEDKLFMLYAGTYKEKMQWVAAISDLGSHKTIIELSPQKIIDEKPSDPSPIKRELPKIPAPEYINSNPDNYKMLPVLPPPRPPTEHLQTTQERRSNTTSRPPTINSENTVIRNPPEPEEDYMLLPGQKIQGPEEDYQLLPGGNQLLPVTEQDEIYQFISPPMSQRSASPLPPLPLTAQMHSQRDTAPQIVIQEIPEEETYADIDIEEPIYECVEQPERPFVPPAPSQVKVTSPLPKPVIPPSPKQTILNELKLKQRLSKSNKEAEIENPPMSTSSHFSRNDRVKKSLSFGRKK